MGTNNDNDIKIFHNLINLFKNEETTIFMEIIIIKFDYKSKILQNTQPHINIISSTTSATYMTKGKSKSWFIHWKPNEQTS